MEINLFSHSHTNIYLIAARAILGKGASSPSDRWAAINYADDELQDEEFV